MSYADAVKRAGPEQNTEEKSAPALLEIDHVESVSTVTQINVDTPSVHTTTSDISSGNNQKDSQVNNVKLDSLVEEALIKDASRSSSDISENSRKNFKAKAKESTGYIGGDDLNPTYLVKVIPAVALCFGLGLGVYRRYTVGYFNWKEVSTWTCVVCAFTVSNFYLTQLFALKFRGKA